MTNKLIGKLSIPVLSLTMVSVLAGCGTHAAGTTGSSGEASTTTKQASNISGTLNLYTSEPSKDAQKVKAAFEKVYPKVHLKVFRSGTEQVVSKIMAEKQAGNVKADVVLLADAPTFEQFKNKGMLLSYHSPEDKQIPKSFIDPSYDFVGTKALTTVIVYNTHKVKQAPTDWSSLLSASAKNQVTMPSPAYSGAAAYNLGVMTRVNNIGWSFFTKLHKNGVVVGKGNGGVITKVSQGQMKYGMVVAFMADAAKRKGSPVDFVYPKAGCPVISEPVGIMKNTHNKAAAEAFENFVLSKSGQKMWSSMGYVPLRSDVAPPAGLKPTQDFKVLSVSNATLAKNRSADKKKFESIMQ